MEREKKLPECEELSRLYRDYSQIEIGRQYGVSRAAVCQAMQKCDIVARTKSEARIRALRAGKIPAHKHREFDRHIFDGWSERMAYMLGFTWAVGGMDQKQSVLFFHLHIDEEDVARKIAATMQGEFLPYRHGRRVDLTYASTEMCSKLIEFGMHDRLIPGSIPYAYLPHFLRAFWEVRGGYDTQLFFKQCHKSAVQSIADTIFWQKCELVRPVLDEYWLYIHDAKKLFEFMYAKPGELFIAARRDRFKKGD